MLRRREWNRKTDFNRGIPQLNRILTGRHTSYTNAGVISLLVCTAQHLGMYLILKHASNDYFNTLRALSL